MTKMSGRDNKPNNRANNPGVVSPINNPADKAVVSSLEREGAKPVANGAAAAANAPKGHVTSRFEFRNTAWKSNIPLILFMFFIVAMGLVILYSVSAPVGYINSEFTSSAYFVMSQLKFSIFGIFLAIVLNFIPIDVFKNRIFMYLAYGVSFALIAATSVIGIERQGARRWIRLAGTEFQTSEVFKIGIIIAFAIYRYWIVQRKEAGKLKPKNPKYAAFHYAFFEFIIPAALFLVPAAIVLVQPHFSCFLILTAVTGVCFLVSGINWRSWVIGVGSVLLAILVVAIPLMLIPSTRDKIVDKVSSNFAHVGKRFSIYTRDEEEEMTDQEKDEALQVTRAKDAIGSGGVSGVGFGSSRSKYSYVSESHNDYIYSIYVEETGFIGGTILIVFYLGFLFMGLRIAYKAKDVFCRIIATGYTFLIVLEAMWNIGVELTVLPSTGITLPFFSYGGTAQVLLLIAYGMVLCVARSGITYEKKDGN